MSVDFRLRPVYKCSACRIATRESRELQMVNIARWTMAHRRIVVVAWIVAAVGILAVSSSVGKKSASNFTLPGTGSQQAVDLLTSRFPAQAGDADQIVFHARTGTLTDAADRATIGTTLATGRPAPARHRRRQPVRGRRSTHLSRRHDRVRHRQLRPTRGRASQIRGQPGHLDGGVGALGEPPGGARRPGDRAGAAELARLRDDRRNRRRDPDPADQLRVVQRDGPPDRDRAARARRRDRRDHARQPRDRHARLRVGACADDRARRRRRLRAVHRHALPRELPPQWRRRASGRRGRDEHLRARGRVRRRDRGNRAAGDVRARRERAQRRGGGSRDRRCAGAQRVADAAARAARLRWSTDRSRSGAVGADEDADTGGRASGGVGCIGCSGARP